MDVSPRKQFAALTALIVALGFVLGGLFGPPAPVAQVGIAAVVIAAALLVSGWLVYGRAAIARPESSADGRATASRRIGVHDGLLETFDGSKQVLADRSLLVGLLAVFLFPILVTLSVAAAFSRTDTTVPVLVRIIDPEALVLWPPAFAFAVGVGVRLVAGRSDGDERPGRTALRATVARWRPLLLWGVGSVVGLLVTGFLALRLGETSVFDSVGTAETELWGILGALYVWSVLTYFVVPVIVFEDAGAVASVRRAMGLMGRNAGAVAATQAVFTGALLLVGFLAFTGAAFAFAGAGISIFILPLGLLFLGFGASLVLLATALVGVSFAAHCSVRYRLYGWTR